MRLIPCFYKIQQGLDMGMAGHDMAVNRGGYIADTDIEMALGADARRALNRCRGIDERNHMSGAGLAHGVMQTRK